MVENMKENYFQREGGTAKREEFDFAVVRKQLDDLKATFEENRTKPRTVWSDQSEQPWEVFAVNELHRNPDLAGELYDDLWNNVVSEEERTEKIIRAVDGLLQTQDSSVVFLDKGDTPSSEMLYLLRDRQGFIESFERILQNPKMRGSSLKKIVSEHLKTVASVLRDDFEERPSVVSIINAVVGASVEVQSATVRELVRIDKNVPIVLLGDQLDLQNTHPALFDVVVDVLIKDAPQILVWNELRMPLEKVIRAAARYLMDVYARTDDFPIESQVSKNVRFIFCRALPYLNEYLETAQDEDVVKMRRLMESSNDNDVMFALENHSTKKDREQLSKKIQDSTKRFASSLLSNTNGSFSELHQQAFEEVGTEPRTFSSSEQSFLSLVAALYASSEPLNADDCGYVLNELQCLNHVVCDQAIICEMLRKRSVFRNENGEYTFIAFPDPDAEAMKEYARDFFADLGKHGDTIDFQDQLLILNTQYRNLDVTFYRDGLVAAIDAFKARDLKPFSDETSSEVWADALLYECISDDALNQHENTDLNKETQKVFDAMQKRRTTNLKNWQFGLRILKVLQTPKTGYGKSSEDFMALFESDAFWEEVERGAEKFEGKFAQDSDLSDTEKDALMRCFASFFPSDFFEGQRKIMSSYFANEGAALESGSYSSEDFLEERETILEDLLKRFHLPVEKMIQAWQESNGSDVQLAMMRNAKMLFDLEKHDSGIGVVLFEQFGIKAFDRYPSGLLIRQYETRDKDVEFGIIITAQSDHNGAFFNSNYSWAIDLDELSGGIIPRVIEVTDVRDLVLRLGQLRRRYGRRAKYGYVSGHGSPDSIALDSSYFMPSGLEHGVIKDDHSLRSVHIGTPYGRAAFGRFFEPGAPVILNSCSTGAQGGIADTAADSWSDVVIHAPDVPSNIASIKASQNRDGAVAFEVSRTHGASDNVFVS